MPYPHDPGTLEAPMTATESGANKYCQWLFLIRGVSGKLSKISYLSGAEGIRTPYLLNANQAFSQLNYGPIYQWYYSNKETPPQFAEYSGRDKIGGSSPVTVAHIIILLATGIGVGFAGGLLGLGGAFIMTPVQYMIFTGMGIPAEIAIKLAFGTSLLVVLPTAVSGAWRHNIKGAVWWKPALVIGSCGLLAAFGGATLAAHLPGGD